MLSSTDLLSIYYLLLADQYYLSLALSVFKYYILFTVSMLSSTDLLSTVFSNYGILSYKYLGIMYTYCLRTIIKGQSQYLLFHTDCLIAIVSWPSRFYYLVLTVSILSSIDLLSI
jgi:hypothetical protein